MNPFQERPLFLESLDVHGIDWVVVFAYFDETGTSGGSERLTAVAGYLFDREGASKFLDLYRTNVEPLIPVDRRGVRMFHAGPCALGYKPFDGMLEKDRERIISQLVSTIQDTVTMGAVVAVDPTEYADGLGDKSGFQVQRNGRKVGLGPWVGSKYSACLMRCIQQMSAWMDQETISEQVEYVFEAGCNHEDEAAQMLALVAKSRELTRRYHMKKYSFAFKGPDNPWFFAPDLMAWEWQRADLNRAEPHRKEWRMTMAELVEAKPHTALYLSPISIGIQAMVNSFYGVKIP